MSNLSDLVKMLKPNNTGSDYTATVTRVDGGTAYVRITGADIMDISAQGYSFPSGHSTSAVALFGSLAYETRKKWAWCLAVLIPVLDSAADERYRDYKEGQERYGRPIETNQEGRGRDQD